MDFKSPIGYKTSFRTPVRFRAEEKYTMHKWVRTQAPTIKQVYYIIFAPGLQRKMGKIRKKFTKCGPFSEDTEFAREKFSVFFLNRHPSMADYGTVPQPHYPVFCAERWERPGKRRHIPANPVKWPEKFAKPFLCFPGPCVKMILTGEQRGKPGRKKKEAH